MSNIYFKTCYWEKVTKLKCQNFEFHLKKKSVKSLSPSHLLVNFNSCRYHWIFKLLLATGRKTVCGFSNIIVILKWIMTI